MIDMDRLFEIELYNYCRTYVLDWNMHPKEGRIGWVDPQSTTGLAMGFLAPALAGGRFGTVALFQQNLDPTPNPRAVLLSHV